MGASLSADGMPLPAGASIVQWGGGHGEGNVLLRLGEGPDAALLKVYRRRFALRSWPRELSKSLSHRVFEGKRGMSPRSRFETERETLSLWAAHDFDVCRLIERPLPPEVSPPALWMEHVPGRTLAEILRDPDAPFEEKAALLRRLASDHAARHARALELGEPLLIQEHSSVKHVLVSGERMVAFDFEGGYRPGFPLLEALAQEISGTLRSIARHGESAREALLDAYLLAYPEPELLRRAAAWGVHGRSLPRRLKRWQDRRRRSLHGKTELLERVLEGIAAAARSRPITGPRSPALPGRREDRGPCHDPGREERA